MLSKRISILIFCLLTKFSYFSQSNNSKSTEYQEYKDPKQFKSFYKRRKIVGAWQVHQLKKGALVVKLKTNQHIINAIKKGGDYRLAEKKRLETLAINMNVFKAFSNQYKFSAVYFIYSHYQDSLLKGARSNIFLDSTLNIDTRITMSESFFLISESDNVYNSSIGFVSEDLAKNVIERGDPTLTKVPIVIKNKYGHQLKRPFPFYFGSSLKFTSQDPTVYLSINGVTIPFFVTGNNLGQNKDVYIYENEPLLLEIPKSYTYNWLQISVGRLTSDLEKYYRKTDPINILEIDPQIKPFLY